MKTISKQQSASMKFLRRKNSDRVFWLDNEEQRIGEMIFTFDKLKLFNLFADYPHALTPEEKSIFDKENRYWADFFQDRAYP